MLSSIGVSEKEALIYLHLAKMGPAKAGDISRKLRMNRVQVYRTLKSLQNKDMIESTLSYPVSFVAVPLEKILDRMISAREDETAHLRNSKADMVSMVDWHQARRRESDLDKFTVLEGRTQIYSKIARMVRETKKKLSVVTSGQGVIQAYRFGLLDYGFDHKENVCIRFIASLPTDANHLEAVRMLLQKAKKAALRFESRIGNDAVGYFPRFLIKDDEELILFLRMDKDESIENLKETGFWTNSYPLIHGFSAFFDYMWQQSKDIRDVIKERDKSRNAQATSP